MSTIRCVYDQEPSFPSSDQHPDALRYFIGGKWVDAIGGQPTAQEVTNFLNPPARAADQLEADCLAYLNGGTGLIDLRKVLKAHVISCEAFRLGVAPGALTGAQLLSIRNRIAAIYKAL